MPNEDGGGRSRRQYLTSAALAGLSGFAGCGGNRDDDPTTNSSTGRLDTSTQSPTETATETETEAETESDTETETPERGVMSEKMVVSHYMTGAMPHGFPAKPPTDPELYDPHGISSQLGGAHLTIPVLRLLHGTDVDAVQMACYELRCAKRFGVDAFDFYYPYTQNGAAMARGLPTIEAFFEAAERFDIDFKFTLCFSHPIGDVSQEEKIQTFAENARDVVDSVGADSPHWLRTDNDRILFYTWAADGIIDPLRTNPGKITQNPDYVADVSEAYETLAEEIGVDAAWMYSIHYPGSWRTSYIDAAIEHFPAVKGWVSNCQNVDVWEYISEQAEEYGTTFSQDVYGDFFDGMPQTGDPPYGSGIHLHDKLSSVKPDDVWRRVHALDLSYNFRAQLERALKRDADLINLTTWNDYLEGHHIAPEINHNFGFAQLLQHYTAEWRGEPEEGPGETAIVFSKKYPWSVTPDPYNIELYPREACVKPEEENYIEVVSILKSPATVKVNNNPPQSVDSGVNVVRVPMEPGPVNVVLTRDGEAFKEFTTPEWITDEPFRTDRLTFSYSSEHERIYRELFGEDATVHTSQQYAVEDGVPNWKREGLSTELK